MFLVYPCGCGFLIGTSSGVSRVSSVESVGYCSCVLSHSVMPFQSTGFPGVSSFSS